MSTFVYALVCIGIVAVKFYFEQKGKSTHSASSGEVLTEVFPMLSELKDETTSKVDEKGIQLEDDTIVPSTFDDSRFMSLRKNDSSVKVLSKGAKVVDAIKSDERPKAEQSSDIARIKLATRDEARRAFVYSEILNRKYE
jgi:hypothetical protein